MSDLGADPANEAGTTTVSNPGQSFNDWLKGITAVAGSVNSLYNGVTGSSNKGNVPSQPKPNLAAASVSSKLIAYLPWIIGGGVALIVLVFFMRKK